MLCQDHGKTWNVKTKYTWSMHLLFFKYLEVIYEICNPDSISGSLKNTIGCIWALLPKGITGNINDVKHSRIDMINAIHLCGAKPLAEEPMLKYWEQISVKSDSLKFKSFVSRKCIIKCHLCHSSPCLNEFIQFHYRSAVAMKLLTQWLSDTTQIWFNLFGAKPLPQAMLTSCQLNP